MSYIQNNSIFWVEVDKVQPNPYQPRRDFDKDKLNDLSESIKMYGLLQPLVVTRQEVEKEDGGLVAIYELISGERRLRASKLAGLVQVPVIIRSGEEDDRVKLELAIIENLQREDLNPVERARAFHQLSEQFGFKHQEIAKKIGKSREYVSNTIRILALPEEILNALSEGRISEGHARPILMLKDKPQEQITLYKEVVFKKLNVRESEAIARRIAYDKIRKQTRAYDPDLVEIEDKLAETLGTRVLIEKKNVGGKITIDFFSNEDLQKLVSVLEAQKVGMSGIGDLMTEDGEQKEEDKVEEKSPLEDIVEMNGEDEIHPISNSPNEVQTNNEFDNSGDDSINDSGDDEEVILMVSYPNFEETDNIKIKEEIFTPSYSNEESEEETKTTKDSSVSDFTI
jgi:ParB family transcriptional regulator, chromosome partitioning protein